jgi:hypothetical protein
MQIENIIYDKKIPFDSRDTKYFTDLAGVYPIPSETIIYKTVTGIGATYGEIKSPRHSIIVMPHIALVKNKHEQHKEADDTFAVYHEVTINQIAHYIADYGGKKKFLTTPKGVDKIIKALEMTSWEHDYTERFFFLVDECHKLVQDSMYRDDMLSMMEHFFTFKSKAMISATPIPPSDPRFKVQGFEHVRVYPLNNYRKLVKLIHTESIIASLKEHVATSVSKHICIFFNSVDGIKELLDKLKINKDYTIFCSQESTKMLKSLDELNVSHEVTNLKRFNFFTSSFFNGLDIQLEHNDVDVLLISDVGFRQHTLIDPFTDTLQIIGRFRKGYKQAIHFNNFKAFNQPISQEQARDNIIKSKVVYEAILALKQSYIAQDFDLFFKQAAEAVKPYANLVDKEGNYNHFLADNYLDDNRVSHYYRSPSALKKAYYDAKLYMVKEDRSMYEKTEQIRFNKATVKYRASSNQHFTDLLMKLEDYKGYDVYQQQRAEIAAISPIIFDGYVRLGYDTMATIKFNKKQIVKALLKLDIAEKKNSFPALTLIDSTFFLNRTYLMPELKENLQDIYDELGIDEVAKATHIELYFHVKTYNKNIDGSTRAYILQEKKFNPFKQYQRV